ncbi:MAG: transaldolase [Thermaerobacter sp.]|nr:transaldolase [Thermaerobacter sp.]
MSNFPEGPGADAADSAVERLAGLGQSIWLDFIRRDWLTDGRVAGLIDQGLRGMTSNPTIFEQAIDSTEGGDAYEAALRDLAREEPYATVQEAYDRLTWDDIRVAADLFLPRYQALHADDGYVSVEVSPLLARDTDATIREARRIWDALARPNVMIKVPATQAGLPAITTLIAEGINVNVTLIFSIERYRDVMDAYIAGLARRHRAGGALDHVRSVASFFVSRMDTLVDRQLDARAAAHPSEGEAIARLHGKAAVANAKLAYRAFAGRHQAADFAALAAAGARRQRPLWASTSTKNPAYPDLLYVDPLIGPDTVNTVPPKTLDAIRDHVRVARTVDHDVDAAARDLDALSQHGIDLKQVTDQLESEGVASFDKSFATLMASLEAKLSQMTSTRGGVR